MHVADFLDNFMIHFDDAVVPIDAPDSGFHSCKRCRKFGGDDEPCRECHPVVAVRRAEAERGK
jgi:hypothetical protein